MSSCISFSILNSLSSWSPCKPHFFVFNSWPILLTYFKSIKSDYCIIIDKFCRDFFCCHLKKMIFYHFPFETNFWKHCYSLENTINKFSIKLWCTKKQRTDTDIWLIGSKKLFEKLSCKFGFYDYMNKYKKTLKFINIPDYCCKCSVICDIQFNVKWVQWSTSLSVKWI